MIQDISWYQTELISGYPRCESVCWLQYMFFFLSVYNVEDTYLWGYFFWHITLICVLCQRTQIWGNIYFGGHRSEYDVRGHRSEEICFWKDIDLGVTSEDTDLRGQGFGRTWIWVWRNDWTHIWGQNTDLSLTYIYRYKFKGDITVSVLNCRLQLVVYEVSIHLTSVYWLAYITSK